MASEERLRQEAGVPDGRMILTARQRREDGVEMLVTLERDREGLFQEIAVEVLQQASRPATSARSALLH